MLQMTETTPTPICQLDDAERVELATLLHGKEHPFTGRALELKRKSGMSWNQLGKKKSKAQRRAEKRARGDFSKVR